MVEARLLHSGGSACLANLGGSCLHRRGSWRPGIPCLGEVQKSLISNHRHPNVFCGMHESIYLEVNSPILIHSTYFEMKTAKVLLKYEKSLTFI